MSMSLEQLTACLYPSLPLPGQAAREALMPSYRRGQPHGAERMHWREAAVLILLYEYEDDFHFPLILRTQGYGVHAGQISLPGGAVEAGESLSACALRECREELGATLDGLRMLRELSPLEVYPSGFIVHPFVACIGARPFFNPEPAEVAGYFEPGLAELLDPYAARVDSAVLDGRTWSVPYYALGGQRVWGATAMILAEFKALVSETYRS
jgi:8-oxo-dGTP pyrophosphatase MutT (NUDIX family)